jgi:hypothetical protein
VKRPGRDELIWVEIHKCMEPTQGISLYSYLYLKLAKMAGFSNYLLWFFSYKIGEQEGRTGSAWRQGGVMQIMYLYVSKCKNDEIKN